MNLITYVNGLTMNSSNETTFKKIANKLDYLKLTRFFNLGRGIDNSEPTFGFDSKLSSNQKLEIKELIKSLYEQLLSNQSKFYPLFVELTFFDPNDSKCNIFYTLLISPLVELFEQYKFEMEYNMELFDKRGPIFPTENLYDNICYITRKECGQAFSEYDVDDLDFRFGGFNAESITTSQGHKINSYVRTFLDSSLKSLSNFENSNNENNSSRVLNCGILIPIFRPAGPIFKGAQKKIFRGGGICLFGHAESDFSEEALVLKIRTYLSKSILEASYHKMAISELKRNQTNIELNLFHHYGSTLRNLPRYLEDEIFDTTVLNNRQKELIKTVRGYISNSINNTRTLLKAYKMFTGVEETKVEFTTVADLCKALDDYRVEIMEDIIGIKKRNLLLDIDRLRLDNKKVTLPTDIFSNFLEQFILNSIKAFEESDNIIPIEKRKIIIRLHRKAHQIVFTFSNNGPKMDKYILETAGFKPIPNPDSSGLGYYFLNLSLKLCGASERSDGRYFELKNSFDKGKGIEFIFSFKIH